MRVYKLTARPVPALGTSAELAPPIDDIAATAADGVGTFGGVLGLGTSAEA